MKRLILGAALAALLAGPALAQSYNPGYGTGNAINEKLAERTNGMKGIGASDYAGSAAFAYASLPRRQAGHMQGQSAGGS
jgi:hypothetical protein